jgi:hypothetical protein
MAERPFSIHGEAVGADHCSSEGKTSTGLSIGWSASGLHYSIPGAPLVPVNQDVVLDLLAPNGFVCAAEIEGLSLWSGKLFCITAWARSGGENNLPHASTSSRSSVSSNKFRFRKSGHQCIGTFGTLSPMGFSMTFVI